MTIPSKCLEYPSNHSEKVKKVTLLSCLAQGTQWSLSVKAAAEDWQSGSTTRYRYCIWKYCKNSQSRSIPLDSPSSLMHSLTLLFSIVIVLFFPFTVCRWWWMSEKQPVALVICQQSCFTSYHSLLTQDQCSGQQQARLLFLKINQLLCWRVWM